MVTVEEKIANLNSVLRGELSAVETYKQALVQLRNDPGAAQLQSILADHEAAIVQLREQIGARGGRAEETSGMWGTFAGLVQAAAKVFGKTAALKALKEGEEAGVSGYEKALEDEHVEPECKTLIRTKLLPQTQAHIPVLDRLMDEKAEPEAKAPELKTL